MLSAGLTCCRCQLFAPSRFHSLNQVIRSARFGRIERSTRGRFKNLSHLRSGTEKGEFLLPHHADSTAVRPPKDIWKALGFTLAVGGSSFAVAAISDYERSKKQIKEFWNDTLKMFQNASDFGFEGKTWKRISDGQKCAAAIIAVNTLVFLLWKVKALEPSMWRYFTNCFASKSLCFPMVFSAFSHSHWLHLGLNMYVLYSFASISIDRFLGVDQFTAFYLTAAAVSSLTSLMHKAAIRSPVRALGASGAILAALVYTCIRMPDARLQIVFVPGFTFSAASAVVALIGFDLAGLVLGFRLFDHAAHLGGTLFGILYAWYGEKLMWKSFGDRVVDVYRRLFERAQ